MDALLAYIVDEVLHRCDHILEIHERQLGFDMPILHEMPLGAALFGTEAGADVVDLLEGMDYNGLGILDRYKRYRYNEVI